MSVLLSKAETPLMVPTDATVFDVVRAMDERNAGAALVMQRGRALGIFTTRDLMTKVVLHGLDPKKAKVGDAMTGRLVTIRPHHDLDEAKQRMLGRRVRHLPIMDDDGRVLGMLTMRRLLEEEADVLRSEAISLENYAGYDGATG
jgi:CBS domain-containing protein